MLWTLIIGLMVGLVAKFFMPGRGPGGFILTILLGIGGAMLATWVGTEFNIYTQSEPAGFIAAVLGSMAILAIYNVFPGNKLIA
jgi:uncharacterized membrane protein YeaQ/YmgE (transglycosylase-associated protein family)